MDFLKVQGTRIVSESGEEVRLRGFSLASWLNFENFIMGIPGHETGLRKAMCQALGQEKAHLLLTSFLRHFITEEDIKFIAQMGCNLVRVPFNYHYFESDDAPGEYLPDGFLWLDRLIGWARDYGVYVILDLHAAPGSQNTGFFSDNISGMAFLWKQRSFQDRTVELWRKIASYYNNEPVIAGYDVINEPNPESFCQLNELYKRLISAIRSVDKRHILFLEGINYSTKFDGLSHPFDNNAVYSCHAYYGEKMEYPGIHPRTGIYYDVNQLRKEYEQNTVFMRRNQVPHWFGETGVTFPAEVTEGSRLRLIKDLLTVVEEFGDSWSFGIYKDIGRTGILYVAPDSPWMQTIQPVEEALDRLQCNSSFADYDTEGSLRQIIFELGDFVKGAMGKINPEISVEEISEMIRFRVCECVLPPLLQVPFVQQFLDLSPEAVERVMQSFNLTSCRKREGWIKVIQEITGKEA